MEENNVVAVAEEPKTSKPPFKARLKEWWRRNMVSLKRKPQNISFLFIAIASIFNLLCLGTYSEAIVDYGSGIDWAGLYIFVNTLFSILVFAAFLSCFPKLKPYGKKTVITCKSGSVKININLIMYAVVFVMLILMIVCEILYYVSINQFYNDNYVGVRLSTTTAYAADLFLTTMTESIVHIVLLGIATVVTALIPVYIKLISKINTSKELESAVGNMQELDLASED